MTRVVLPVWSMRMNAFGANWSALFADCFTSSAARSGRWKASVNPAAKPPARTPRREGGCARFWIVCMAASLRPGFACGALDRVANAHIGAAAADVTRHRRVDIGIVRMGNVREQGSCRHDLARLAIAALDNFQIEPGFLHLGSRRCCTDTFNCGDGLVAHGADWKQTRAHRRAVDMHRACATLRYPAAEFCAGHSEHV